MDGNTTNYHRKSGFAKGGIHLFNSNVISDERFNKVDICNDGGMPMRRQLTLTK